MGPNGRKRYRPMIHENLYVLRESCCITVYTNHNDISNHDHQRLYWLVYLQTCPIYAGLLVF